MHPAQPLGSAAAFCTLGSHIKADYMCGMEHNWALAFVLLQRFQHFQMAAKTLERLEEALYTVLVLLKLLAPPGMAGKHQSIVSCLIKTA